MTSPASSITERTYRGWSSKLFASAVVAEGPRKTVYLCGTGSNDLETGRVVHVGDFAAQVRFTYEQVKEVLALHGATLADVVKITAYVLDASVLPEYNKVRLEAFGDAPLSPHTFFAVKELPLPEMLIEIDVVASIPA